MEPGAEFLAISFEIGVAAICTLGGFRFRRWAVEGRDRIPRYPETIETIICWSIYSVVVSFFVFWGRNTVFEFHSLGLF